MAFEAPDISWPDYDLPERQLLEAFVDSYRTLLVRKAAGLDQAQLATALPPSTLTLGGLLKHMALVEDGWFTEFFLGRPMPEDYGEVDWEHDLDWEWRTAGADTPDDLREMFDAACERSRAVVAGTASLDAMSVRHGEGDRSFPLRWIMVHMIEEYARHCGHADLIRESIDGATGN
jgi:uncharacterized damage-inducible protein DinB